MYSKDFLEKDVFTSDGWKIGKSKELICDQNTWQITKIELELNDKIAEEIGESVPLRRHHVPLDVSLVQGIGDVIPLKATKEDVVKVLSAYSKIARQPEPDKKSGPITV